MKLNYKKHGEGIPVIILHGLFGSLDNWQTFGKRLGERFEVYLVDQRNHGHSPHSEQFNYESMADDLKTLFDDEYIRGAYLVGHSMGGKTAMFFAQQFPELIEKLVVLDIGPKYYEPHHQRIIEGLKSIDLNIVKTRKEAETIISEYIDELGVRQFLLKNLFWKEKGQLAWRMNLDVIANCIEEVGKVLPVGEIKSDTLFVRGGKSNYILDSDFVQIETQFPNSKLISIENAGHWIHAEKPEQLFNSLGEFFNS